MNDSSIEAAAAAVTIPLIPSCYHPSPLVFTISTHCHHLRSSLLAVPVPAHCCCSFLLALILASLHLYLLVLIWSTLIHSSTPAAAACSESTALICLCPPSFVQCQLLFVQHLQISLKLSKNKILEQMKRCTCKTL
jgi:hypothetical protein